MPTIFASISRRILRAGPRLAALICIVAGAGTAARGAAARVPTSDPAAPIRAIAPPFEAEATGLPAPQFDVSSLKAGDRVTLRWNTLKGVAEELELVFSMDDGRRFDVRVSPQLNGGESRYVWRVPNVGVRAARVHLRARIDGHERIGSASEPFRILADPLKAPGLWVMRQGEWYEEAGGQPFALPGLVAPPGGPNLRADWDPPPVTAPHRAPVAGRPVPQTALDSAFRFEPPDASPPDPRVAVPFRPVRE